MDNLWHNKQVVPPLETLRLPPTMETWVNNKPLYNVNNPGYGPDMQIIQDGDL